MQLKAFKAFTSPAQGIMAELLNDLVFFKYISVLGGTHCLLVDRPNPDEDYLAEVKIVCKLVLQPVDACYCSTVSFTTSGTCFSRALAKFPVVSVFYKK